MLITFALNIFCHIDNWYTIFVNFVKWCSFLFFMVPFYISCFVNFLLSATVRPCFSTTSTFPEHPAKSVSSVIDPAGNRPRLCNEAIYSRESYMYMGSLGQAFRIAIQKVLTSYYVDGDIAYVDRNHIRLTHVCF